MARCGLVCYLKGSVAMLRGRIFPMLQEFFLEAMADGYVNNEGSALRMSGLPGEKIITYKRGNLTLVDRYFVLPKSDKSSGQTIIFKDDNPLWVMTYEGYYLDFAIDILKLCLRKAYCEDKSFYGGRGPVVVQGQDWGYFNCILRSEFENFAGEERIIVNGVVVGRHNYRGMIMY